MVFEVVLVVDVVVVLVPPPGVQTSAQCPPVQQSSIVQTWPGAQSVGLEQATALPQMKSCTHWPQA